jgi:CubicO group peptidase (beta-lactamase class C family)
LPPATILVVDHGRLVVQWGDPAMRVKISSVRKSFLSALYGVYVREGRINLDQRLAQLGIDDQPLLTDVEKQATVRSILQSRSGVYHGYVAGTPGMRAATPARGSHAPGSFWYYNNWDFNVLGTVFEKLTATGIADALRDRIAKPIGMEDYRPEDLYYQYSPPDAAEFARSTHRAYPIRLTARDMARFGYLFLRQGNWNGRQIVPREWVTESTRAHAKVGKNRYAEAGPANPPTGECYANCWWVDGFGLPVKSSSARGAMAKYIVVIPDRDLVLVYQSHAESPDDSSKLTPEEYAKLPAPTASQIERIFNLPCRPSANLAEHVLHRQAYGSGVGTPHRPLLRQPRSRAHLPCGRRSAGNHQGLPSRRSANA